MALVGLGLAAGCGIPSPLSRSAPRLPTIGILSPLADGPRETDPVDVLEAGLRDLGYIDGESVRIERRFADGQAHRLPELAADLVNRRVDVLVAIGAAIVPARDATSTIPIVMVNAANPIGQGLVTNLAHPGGNLTGLSVLQVQLASKRLELLKQAVPSVSHVRILGAPGVSDDTRVAATALGLQIDAVWLDTVDDVDRAFAGLAPASVDGLMLYGQPVTLSRPVRIVDRAVGAQLPLMGDRNYFAEVGSLLSYGSNDQVAIRRAAAFVDKILRGVRPGDLPIEQPAVLDFVVNLKTARALRLSIPPSVLAQATEVIQ